MSKRTGGIPQLKAKKLAWRARKRKGIGATGHWPIKSTNKYSHLRNEGTTHRRSQSIAS